MKAPLKSSLQLLVGSPLLSKIKATRCLEPSACKACKHTSTHVCHVCTCIKCSHKETVPRQLCIGSVFGPWSSHQQGSVPCLRKKWAEDLLPRMMKQVKRCGNMNDNKTAATCSIQRSLPNSKECHVCPQNACLAISDLEAGQTIRRLWAMRHMSGSIL